MCFSRHGRQAAPFYDARALSTQEVFVPHEDIRKFSLFWSCVFLFILTSSGLYYFYWQYMHIFCVLKRCNFRANLNTSRFPCKILKYFNVKISQDMFKENINENFVSKKIKLRVEFVNHKHNNEVGYNKYQREDQVTSVYKWPTKFKVYELRHMLLFKIFLQAIKS